MEVNFLDELLKEDQVKDLIKITRSNSTKEPVIDIENIQEISWFQNRLQKFAGFTLYRNEN